MLIGQNGNNQFSLEIMDYQFPGNRSNDYDANWLSIKIVALSQKAHWEMVDPALLTWEIEQLIDWLKALALDKEQWRCISFIEPNIWLEMVEKEDDQITLDVHLELEFRAPDSDEDHTTLRIQTDKTQLEHWAGYLQLQLNQYPVQIIVPTL